MTATQHNQTDKENIQQGQNEHHKKKQWKRNKATNKHDNKTTPANTTITKQHYIT